MHPAIFDVNNNGTSTSIPVNSVDDDVGYNWEELIKLAKELEREIDLKLMAISRLLISSSSTNIGSESGLLSGIESHLKRLDNVIEMMTELLGQVNGSVDASGGKAVTAHHLLNRHREIFQEYQKEFRKAKIKLSSSREQAELLNSVREEINAYRKRDEERLLTEKARVERAQSHTDHIIEIAQGVHQGLLSQGSGLRRAYRKFKEVLDGFPVISTILTRIHVRRSRDTMILGLVIAICCFVLFLLW
jgi:Golgi SNAP receptor complex protein 1